MKTRWSISVLFLMVLLLTACQKDEKDNGDSLLVATEAALATNLFDDVFKQADAGARNMDNSLGNGQKSLDIAQNGCPVITIEPFDAITFPKTITINFGDNDCTGVDLRRRRGVVIATVTDWYRNPGCSLTVTTQDYYVDDYKVEGTKTLVNLGRNNDQHLTYSVSVTNGVITHPDDKVTEWNSSRTNEWVEGEDTPYILIDDVYHITGTGGGVSSDGESYQLNILEALDVQVGCRWIRGGVIEIIPLNRTGIQVDFGDGSCDALAEAIVLGVRIPFSMN